MKSGKIPNPNYLGVKLTLSGNKSGITADSNKGNTNFRIVRLSTKLMKLEGLKFEWFLSNLIYTPVLALCFDIDV